MVFRGYLENLRRKLIRKGYETPVISENATENELYSVAMVIMFILELVEDNKFYERERIKFYGEFIAARREEIETSKKLYGILPKNGGYGKDEIPFLPRKGIIEVPLSVPDVKIPNIGVSDVKAPIMSPWIDDDDDDDYEFVTSTSQSYLDSDQSDRGLDESEGYSDDDEATDGMSSWYSDDDEDDYEESGEEYGYSEDYSDDEEDTSLASWGYDDDEEEYVEDEEEFSDEDTGMSGWYEDENDAVEENNSDFEDDLLDVSEKALSKLSSEETEEEAPEESVDSDDESEDTDNNSDDSNEDISESVQKNNKSIESMSNLLGRFIKK